MKKLFSIFSVALFAVVLLCLNTVTSAAEEPTTYPVKYNVTDNTWYYETESGDKDINYLLHEIKDGDYVVVDAAGGGWSTLKLDYNLGNLTVLPGSSCMITVKSIAECYVLDRSYVSITADVDKGFVYGNADCNFNLNCNKLELIFDGDESEMSVNVLGTCNELYVHSNTKTEYHVWNFKDDLVFKEGILETSSVDYSINPPAAAPEAAVTAPAADGNANTSSADEYDDVPKTGESAGYLWMFVMAAFCFAGSYYFKKK